MIRRALARADRIITVSYNSKRDLVDYFGISPSRVEVIYNGVSPRFRPDVPGRSATGSRRSTASPALPPVSGRREAA